MKIEMGKKYKTRDGRDVRIYAVDGFGVHCVHGAYFDTADYGEVGWIDDSWTINGEVVEGQEGFDLELVEAKEDLEIAKELLKTKSAVLVKINGDIFQIRSIETHEDTVTIGVSYEEHYMRFENMQKSEFKLATKEEVIEYFFGGENEN